MTEQGTRELEQALWEALRSDRVVMLGLDGVDDGHMRPMTAQLEHAPAEGEPGQGTATDRAQAERNPGSLWFFSATDNALVRGVGHSDRAIAAFASRDHALFASIEGSLQLHHDRETIDRLWNPFVAAWYDGKDDPRLALLRFDPAHAQIWRNAGSLVAGVRILLGGDPRQEYQDDVAQVNLH